MKVYKVSYGCWSLYTYDSELSVRYEIGQIATAKVGALFAFDDLEHTRDFWGDPKCTVFICEAEPYQDPPPKVARHLNLSNITAFWAGKAVDTRDLLEGTALCKWIKPTRRLT